MCTPMENALSRWDALRVAAGAAAVVLLVLHGLPPLASADRLVDDFAVARLAPATPQHDRIAIIAITEDSLAALPYRSPLDRAMLAGLVGALKDKGAAVIGLDVLFDQPSEPAKDAALHDALTAPGAPVVALAAGQAAQLTERQRQFHTQFLHGLLSGHGHLARDRLDGVVRRQMPWLDGQLSLPATMAAATGLVPATLAPGVIDWVRSAKGAFPTYPAEAVPLLPRAWLDGKLVLVGLEVPDADRHRTPLTLGAATMPGVEIQAQILAQMLDGRRAKLLGPVAGGVATMVLAAAGAGLAAARLSVARLALVAVLGTLALWAAWGASAAMGGPILSPLGPSLAWLVAMGAALGMARTRERAARDTLMDLFAAHLSAPVAEEVWRHRDQLLAGGRPRPQSLVATVMFSDVENFTPASEELGPERLMDWIETYLEAMTEIITAHGGIVLRFLGDGILAAFGAPLPRGDEAAITADAIQAVQAALAMEDALHRLNHGWAAQGLPEIRIRVGMTTGAMVGGSVGARRHLEYTLMGDSVNTAARLEALAKSVAITPGSPCRILAAGTTWDRVQGVVAGRLVGEITVKGKRQAVEVYQILAGPTPPTPPLGSP
ncbi:MAG: adenylate/guanylate cyclase domain-containing protein [Rhodospirillaceae bacterium]|nr:adenylate/guanylate cyclase domain-containing protein [Rhodospirillales bacterium]